MHIHVNTASEHLRDFAERLPELFDREGEVLHAGRNTIKAFEAEGERLVVKRFKRPNLLRAVIYTFFRRSKARRSYEHAVRLRALGVDSPEPVAWSEYRRRGLLCDSYYVSRRSDYTPLSQTTARFPAAGTLPVLEAFARFAVQLHEKGIEHRDFNHGNILWDRTPAGAYRFQLIDINRMHFDDRPPLLPGLYDQPPEVVLPRRGIPLHPRPLRRNARMGCRRHAAARDLLPAGVRPPQAVAQAVPAPQGLIFSQKNTVDVWFYGLFRYICQR